MGLVGRSITHETCQMQTLVFCVCLRGDFCSITLLGCKLYAVVILSVTPNQPRIHYQCNRLVRHDTSDNNHLYLCVFLGHVVFKGCVVWNGSM